MSELFWNTVDAYIAAHPGSALTEYFESAGDDLPQGMDFGYRGGAPRVRGDSVRIRPASITFTADMAEVEQVLSADLRGMRAETVRQLTATSGPQTEVATNYVAGRGQISADRVRLLAEALNREVGTPVGQQLQENHLPISVAFDTRTSRIRIDHTAEAGARDLGSI